MGATRRFALFAALALHVAGCGGPTAPSASPAPVSSAFTLTCAPPLTATATTSGGMAVTYAQPSVSGGTAPVTVNCTPPSGGTFGLGTTEVKCLATDAVSRTASCEFPVTVERAPQLARTRFLAFGDSITAGEVTYPLASLPSAQPAAGSYVLVLSAAYPTVLGDLLKTRYVGQPVGVVNAGKPGERAAEATKRFTDAMTANRPDAVLLLEGFNDLANGSAAGSQGLRAIESMAKDARLRGARVFLATLTPPVAGASRALPLADVLAFNDRLRLLAASEGAALVDLYGSLAQGASMYIGPDGLHPNEAGYRQIALAFFGAIEADLEVHVSGTHLTAVPADGDGRTLASSRVQPSPASPVRRGSGTY